MINLTIGEENIVTGIVSGSISIKRSICQSGELQFGGCIASQLDIELYQKDVVPDVITIGKDGIPLFSGIIDSATETVDTTRITAYDRFYSDGDTNVIDWYNDLEFPVTLSDMLYSLLDYMNMEYNIFSLPNGDMSVEKTVSGDSMAFRTVLKQICEINGGFGLIDATGKFDIVYFKKSGGKIISVMSGYEYEKYTVKPIDKVQLRSEESDIGYIYGTGTNAYIIQGNFLLYGKGSDELQEIAKKLFNTISGISYVPINAEVPVTDLSIGLDGFPVLVESSTAATDTYIMAINLSGSQLSTQKIISYGEEYRAEVVEDANSELSATQYKVLKIRKTVDGMSATIEQLGDSIKEIDGEVANVTEQVASVSLDLSGFKTSVSETYATQKSVTQSIDDLQQQIDGAIETYTGSEEPTLANHPANGWVTDTEKDTHIGDLYIVNSDGGDKAGFYYRFEKVGTTYQWTLLKDSEVTKALQDAKEANEKAQSVADDLSVNYSTTVQMNSAIEQSASAIKQTVSETYATIQEFEDVTTTASSAYTIATQTATQFSWLVQSAESSSSIVMTDTAIIAIADKLKVTGDMIVDGAITADKIDVSDLSSLQATIGGFSINTDGIYKISDNETSAMSTSVTLIDKETILTSNPSNISTMYSVFAKEYIELQEHSLRVGQESAYSVQYGSNTILFETDVAGDQASMISFFPDLVFVTPELVTPDLQVTEILYATTALVNTLQSYDFSAKNASLGSIHIKLNNISTGDISTPITITRDVYITGTTSTDLHNLSVNGTVTASSFDGNATSATYARLITTNPATGTTYYLPFTGGITGNTNYALRGNSGIKYLTLQGTESVDGYGLIVLGNSIESGTADNKRGGIRLYCKNTTYYTQIEPNANTSANRQLALPDASGTIALTSSLSSYLPLAGGTMTGQITSRNIVPSATHTYNLGSSTMAYQEVYSRYHRARDTYGNNYASLYAATYGTTSSQGVGQLTLGNNIAVGTNGNAYGLLRIYGGGTGYIDIKPVSTALEFTTNYTLYLPITNGTLTTSDIRAKENISYLSDIADIRAMYMKFRPVRYKYKKDMCEIHYDNKWCFGFVAQEVDKILPHEEYAILDVTEKYACRAGYFDNILGLDKEEIIALNTYMIQNHENDIETIKQQLKEAQEEIAGLKSQLAERNETWH